MSNVTLLDCGFSCRWLTSSGLIVWLVGPLNVRLVDVLLVKHL